MTKYDCDLSRRDFVSFWLLFVIHEETNGRVGLNVGLLDLLVVADEYLGFEEHGEHLHERVHLDLRQIADVLDEQLGILVEQEQDGYLKGGRLQRVAILEAVGDDLALGQAVQPAQLAPIVLAAVVVAEALTALLKLQIQIDDNHISLVNIELEKERYLLEHTSLGNVSGGHCW